MLSFHISITFFQNLKKKLNSAGTSPDSATTEDVGRSALRAAMQKRKTD